MAKQTKRMPEHEEQRLFVKSAAGDKAAFEELCVHYRDDVTRYASSVLRGTAACGVGADDIASMVFESMSVRILESGPPRVRRPFQAWAMKAAGFRARDYRERAAREADRERSVATGKSGDERLRGLVAGVPFRDPDVSELEHAAREDTLERLREAISDLRAEERAVVLLWLEGLTTREVAAELGIDPGTVSRRFRRACNSLYMALGTLYVNAATGLGYYRKISRIDKGGW